MADYYPLIARAVNNLARNTAETRGVIYRRARAAMLAQLRSVTPALSESDINREHVALEEAIKKVETESPRRSDTPWRRSLSRPEPPHPPIQEFGDEQAEMSNAEYRTQPGSSVVQPQYIGPPTPVVPHFWMEKIAAETRWSPSRLRKLSLTIAAFLLPALAVAGVWKGPGIISSFHSTSNFNGATETAARGALSKIADRVDSAPVASSSSNDSAMLAQKVMLYEQDEAHVAGKSFRGTAAWYADDVSPTAAQGAKVAIRADIEIPEERISVRWTLSSNEDKSLSESHTIEIMFKLPPDFAHGGISKIPGMLMKQSELTRGVPLAGLGVKVATNFFLISLSSAEADVQRNIQLLREQPWFDIPIVYDDGRRAIIAVEKGASGERAFSEAFAAWEE
jgi:hypothetical protein